MNVIRGRNAHGKTSLLEAILYAATSKSHRTNSEQELLRTGAESFTITLDADSAGGNVKLQAAWRQGTKRFKVNGVPQERISEILGRVRIVFFSPEDLRIVKDSAAARRQFLDMELAQISPVYLASLQHYRNALRQRNELLRSESVDQHQLDAWDALLVKHGTVVMQERTNFIRQLNPLAERFYANIAEREQFHAQYKCDTDTPGAFSERLAAARASDIRRQQTARGPHRDDVDFFIDDRPARSHASQGQQRSAALALKFAEVELIRARTGEYPVLMLDEVLSELDDSRAERLFHAIPSGVQAIITTANLENRRSVLHPDAKRFTVTNGLLAEET